MRKFVRERTNESRKLEEEAVRYFFPPCGVYMQRSEWEKSVGFAGSPQERRGEGSDVRRSDLPMGVAERFGADKTSPCVVITCISCWAAAS